MVAEGSEGKMGRQKAEEDTGFSVIHCGHLTRKLKTQDSVDISLHPSLACMAGLGFQGGGDEWGQPMITDG